MLIIDAHLDLAMNALLWNRDLTQSVMDIRRGEEGMTAKGRALGTVAFPEMRAGRVAVCLGTVLARVARRGGTYLDFRSHEIAYAMAQGQLAYYRVLQEQGELRLITDWAGLAAHMEEWERPTEGKRPLGLILSMEGADPIVTPDQAEAWWRDGLRVVSLAHYGASQYAHGTGTDGGVSPLGRQLLREMERLGMILDLTHLADQAFWEAIEAFGGPVLASHNNCRALVPGQRQFADEQLQAIVRRGGVIGLAWDAWMLVPGWIKGQTSNTVVSMEAVVDQIDHICQLAGNANHVAIGTDLDGGYGYEQTPHDCHTIADLQALPGLLARRRYTGEQVRQIMHGNWLRFFRSAWSGG